MTTKSLAEQYQSRCVHYRRGGGLRDGEACEAGVVYGELARVGELGWTGCALRLPCVRWDDRKGQPLMECPHLRWPTDEETYAYVAEREAGDRDLRKVMVAVQAVRRDHAGKAWAGDMECPLCGGRLRMRSAASNGHMHVRCDMPGCVSWME